MDPKIQAFIEGAKAGGASDQSIVGILAARGWSEKEVYAALAGHYERVTGTEIPVRGSGGTGAKDAFFYLLVFSTLATWTIGLGSLAFSLIDRWLSDMLFSSGNAYGSQYEMYSIASEMASVLVAFPVFLLVSRAVIRDARKHPEKLDSAVRRWLTYMALVVAAGVFIGDLITVLTYFLRGETTSRFLTKALVVLLLSGGVFFYYYSGLRKPEHALDQGASKRDVWMAGLSAVASCVMVIFGFLQIGGPSTQRLLRADQKRLQDLFQLSVQINSHWKGDSGKLPEHLDDLPGVVIADPITRKQYEYRAQAGSRYELCAVFSTASERAPGTSSSPAWFHSAGRYCFQLDATQETANPPTYLPD